MPFSAQQIKSARLHLQQNDPVMKRLLKRVGPFTGKTTRNRFGTLVKSIVSQQISTSAAKTIHQRLNDLVNSSQRRNFKVEPKDLLALSVDDLRTAGISNQKANYLLDLATKVNDATIDLQAIHRLEDEEVIQVLIQVKGIGRWTAQMFLMFCLGRMDILPAEDLGIKNAIAAAYELDERPSRDDIETIAQPWRPYASIASWYLWRSLEVDS